jgi:trafficking protein particle complex subunit 1
MVIFVLETQRSTHLTWNHIADCIYKRRWTPRPSSSGGKPSRPTSDSNFMVNGGVNGTGRPALSAEDDAKLIFGTVFSLRNMVRKLGGDDDRFEGPTKIYD